MVLADMTPLQAWWKETSGSQESTFWFWLLFIGMGTPGNLLGYGFFICTNILTRRIK